ncbi:hypothetical protein INT47_011183 [Mucor saturninus]|uniref:Galactose oxidase n=1 Tax=Mucor saturninus TaxID=64648 RepID=A0A8H7RLA2_9FUNG|nr:hypothetical protein INT47_011183 [Mucor saturninus]
MTAINHASSQAVVPRYSAWSTSKDLSTQWESISTDTGGITLESRRFAQTLQLPDGNSMLISGGSGPGDIILKDQTLIFNGETRTWNRSVNYAEYPYGNRQIYNAASVYVPGFGVGFFGGEESTVYNNHSIPYVYKGVNITRGPDEYPGNMFNYIGYTNLTFFNINHPEQPWSYFPNQRNLPNAFTSFQESIFDYKTNRILYFGGVYWDTIDLHDISYDLRNITTFDMKNSQWGQQILQGNTPSVRQGHSVTLLDPDQRHVLLYGGQIASSSRVVTDYCFTLDLDTYQWKQHYLSVTDTISLLRTQHSALNIDNDTVFIVFGKDSLKTATLEPIMLNVTDPSRITLLDRYNVLAGPISNSTHANSDEASETGKSKLSSGATIGISVGCAFIGLIAIAALVFWMRKRSKAKTQMESTEVHLGFYSRYTNNRPIKPDSESTALNEKPDTVRNPQAKAWVTGFPNYDRSALKDEQSILQKPDGA